MKKIRWSQVLVALVALTLAYAPASDAGVMTYNNAATWAAATGAASPATVGGAPAAGVTINSNYAGFAISAGGVISDQVGTTAAQVTTWSFATPIFGFGANWDLTPGGAGTGLIITVSFMGGGTLALPELSNSYNGGFFGFASTEAITGFLITEGTQTEGAYRETFSMNGATTTDAVPEPATLFLLGAGLFGTGAAARRRRRNQ